MPRPDRSSSAPTSPTADLDRPGPWRVHHDKDGSLRLVRPMPWPALAVAGAMTVGGAVVIATIWSAWWTARDLSEDRLAGLIAGTVAVMALIIGVGVLAAAVFPPGLVVAADGRRAWRVRGPLAVPGSTIDLPEVHRVLLVRITDRDSGRLSSVAVRLGVRGSAGRPAGELPLFDLPGVAGTRTMGEALAKHFRASLHDAALPRSIIDRAAGHLDESLGDRIVRTAARGIDGALLVPQGGTAGDTLRLGPELLTRPPGDGCHLSVADGQVVLRVGPRSMTLLRSLVGTALSAAIAGGIVAVIVRTTAIGDLVPGWMVVGPVVAAVVVAGWRSHRRHATVDRVVIHDGHLRVERSIAGRARPLRTVPCAEVEDIAVTDDGLILRSDRGELPVGVGLSWPQVQWAYAVLSLLLVEEARRRQAPAPAR